jgi:hypothetical protein
MKINGVSNASEELDGFLDRFNDGKFDGCYVNGILVKSSLEREATKKQLTMQYENNVIKLKQKVMDSIKPHKII